MIRNSAKLTALAAATLLGSVVTVNCSKGSGSDDKTVGHVSLDLKLASGATVSSVHYLIHAGMPSGIADVNGDINISDVNSTTSAFHSFPASTGDVVTLTAMTSTGTSCTGTSSPFAVTAGNTASVAVTLVCGGSVPTQGSGSVGIGGTIVEGDNCPLLTSWSASPLQTSVGATIDVSGAATDADVGVIPGESLTFAWTASPGGTFTNAAALSTQFTCGVSGANTITLTVSDNHVPSACSTKIDIPVNCVGGVVCGNGVVEAGEVCDPAGSYTSGVGICAADCKSYLPAVCGNSKLETGEQCDPPNGTTCSATCQTVVQSQCGNNVKEAGEDCDPPNGKTCDNNCKTIPESACQMCEITNTTGGTCFQTSNTSNAGTTNYAVFGCNGFSGADFTNCVALIGCLRSNHCGSGDDPTPCLCGNLSTGACATTPPANLPGVCASKYVTAAAGGDVFGLFFSTDSPIGISNNLYSCDVDACASGVCL
ncbi:MAG TPA: hypothetical protein VHJ20_03145 [Polyangia bacterium]|nr:hypothetical protein [Polyangia bacterium]